MHMNFFVGLSDRKGRNKLKNSRIIFFFENGALHCQSYKRSVTLGKKEQCLHVKLEISK